jgi:hypothetical protein
VNQDFALYRNNLTGCSIPMEKGGIKRNKNAAILNLAEKIGLSFI